MYVGLPGRPVKLAAVVFGIVVETAWSLLSLLLFLCRCEDNQNNKNCALGFSVYFFMIY